MADNKSEFNHIVADVKELARFMLELGVDDFPAAFSGPDATEVTKHKNAASEDRVTASEIESVVSSLRTQAGSAKSAPADPKSRRDLLGGTKISDLKEVREPLAAKPKETRKKPKRVVAVETTSNALFSDKLPESNETIEQIRADIGADCARCELCENRTQVVNSVGNPKADLMIIGEAPGADEDLKGTPFVGRAGKLLTKILEAIGFSRDDVFIGNINRCRPPQNRQPTLEESAACKPFLIREIASVRPRVIVVLGNTATKNLLNTTTGITKLRGQFSEYLGIKVMPTFHPAYLLRDPRKKREVWDDMRTVRDFLQSTDG